MSPALKNAAVILCGRCGRDVPFGGAHIIVSPYGPNQHVLYCPGCCPCEIGRSRDDAA